VSERITPIPVYLGVFAYKKKKTTDVSVEFSAVGTEPAEREKNSYLYAEKNIYIKTNKTRIERAHERGRNPTKPPRVTRNIAAATAAAASTQVRCRAEAFEDF